MKSKLVVGLFLPCLLLSFSALAQSVEKVLVKSIPLGTFEEVQLDLPGSVEVREWSNPYLRIQMSVKLENGTEAALKAFVRTGRYNIVAKPEEGFLKVCMPGLKRDAKVGAETAIESFQYVVYKPAKLKEKEQTQEAGENSFVVLSAM